MQCAIFLGESDALLPVSPDPLLARCLKIVRVYNGTIAPVYYF